MASQPFEHNPRVQKLERELESVQSLLSNLDRSMGTLMDSIEEMKPAYLHAMKLLSQANPPSAAQKNNLVFYGLAPEPLEVQMEQEPEFCRDILETRIKLLFREYLKIARDIPFTHIYRFTTANADPNEIRPIVAGFKSIRDKENILRHASSNRPLKQAGVYVTEDFSSKKVVAKGGVPGSPTKIKPLIGAPQIGSPVKKKEDTVRDQLESSAGMSDRLSSCNSDYAPSSNSGNSSSGGFTD